MSIPRNVSKRIAARLKREKAVVVVANKKGKASRVFGLDKYGKKRKWTPPRIQELLTKIRGGMTYEQVGIEFGVSANMAKRVFKKWQATYPA